MHTEEFVRYLEERVSSLAGEQTTEDRLTDARVRTVLELNNALVDEAVALGLTTQEHGVVYIMEWMKSVRPIIEDERHTVMDEQDALIAVGEKLIGPAFATQIIMRLQDIWNIQ